MAVLVERKKLLHEVGGDETLLETPYGMAQNVDSRAADQVEMVISNFTFYMESIIFTDSKYDAVKKTCKNRHRDCAFWTTLGECEAVSRHFNFDVQLNPGCYILVHYQQQLNLEIFGD